MKNFRVYGKSGAGSLIVEYLMELAGAEYELICPDKETRQGEAYRSIAPHGLIPAIETPEGHTMCESLAITLYLLERFPETGMIAPQGHPERMKCMQWLSLLSTSLYNANLRWYYAETFGPEEAIRAKAETDRRAIYDLIEARTKVFLAGQDMSAADLYLYMLLEWDNDLSAELETRPVLKRIREEVGALPEIRNVMARQP